jgi:long-chain acyl-CoA synthetase
MPMLYSMRLNAIDVPGSFGLPFMFTALLQRQQAHPRNIDCLRTCIAAGDVCPPQVQDQFPSVFGIPLRSSWAATEALGSLTYGLESGPVNRIVKNAQVRGLVDDNRMPVSPGEVGELVVRGPHVTIGYWAGAGLVEDAPEGGWFHTGDLMRQDEKGNLWFVTSSLDWSTRRVGSCVQQLKKQFGLRLRQLGQQTAGLQKLFQIGT